MTKQEIQRIGANIMANDSSAIMGMIDIKSKMQQTFINQLSSTESIEMIRNEKNQNVINKLYKLGALEIQKTGSSDENYYITSLVIGTILKEIYEDQSYVSVDSLYTIINNIKRI